MKRYLEAGRLNAPRGLKGEVRFSCWCDSMEFLSGVSKLYLDPEGKAYLEVERMLPHLGTIVFKGYGDRTSASALNGRTLWFDREDVTLPAGSWFNDDLIGTPVFDLRSERTVGVVRAVEERGGRFLWLIGDGETEFLFPPAPEYLVSVKPGEEIRIRLIDGFAPGTES
ncbi:MAG: hypothetical protein J1E00_00865 [Oscillospiraceae bacterium]|nr:hypothetical protein [Oscillospiraceae bacterium]